MSKSRKLVDNQELLGGIHKDPVPCGAQAFFVDEAGNYRPLTYRHLARQSGPKTSKEGVAHIVKRLPQAQERALQAVSRHPGLTCAETEQAEGVRERTYGRRLHELVRAGKIQRCEARICAVSGLKAHTWAVL